MRRPLEIPAELVRTTHVLPQVTEVDRRQMHAAFEAMHDDKEQILTTVPVFDAYAGWAFNELDLHTSFMSVLVGEMMLGQSKMSADDNARVMLATMISGGPQLLALQIALGARRHPGHVMRVVQLLSRAESSGTAIDHYFAGAEGTPADLCRTYRGEGTATVAIERVRKGVAILRRTAALASESRRSRILCVIAWLQWASGQRGIALFYVDEAIRTQPSDGLALQLKGMITSRLPEWCD